MVVQNQSALAGHLVALYGCFYCVALVLSHLNCTSYEPAPRAAARWSAIDYIQELTLLFMFLFNLNPNYCIFFQR
jgi:hypothetical protein